MAKRFLIVHMDGKLQVFDADTERRQFLDRVLHYSTSNDINKESKLKMSKIVDGRIEDVYSTDYLESVLIGNATTYVATLGSDIDIKTKIV